MHSAGISSLIELRVQPVRRLAMPDHIYATLKQRILTCELLPGERLVEKDLCAASGVSRTPLREALNRLSLEGLVSLIPYSGYTVAPITLQELRELCEVRQALEAQSAALAAMRATEADLLNLKRRARFRHRRGDRRTYRRYLRDNSEFHLTLVRASRNRRLESIVMSVLDQLQRPLYLWLDVGLDARAATAEHLAILEAVESRNAERARQVVGEQMRQSGERILAALANLGPTLVSHSTKAAAGRKVRLPGA